MFNAKRATLATTRQWIGVLLAAEMHNANRGNGPMADKAEEHDRYGGWTGITTTLTGFFRIEKLRKRWWFITPEGNVFMSTGMNHVDFREDYSPEFVRFVVEHLRDWGFNTIGWSQDTKRYDFRVGDTPPTRGWGAEEYEHANMPYTHIVRFADIEWYSNEAFPDVFSREWEEKCNRLAARDCPLLKDDPNLVGYFYTDTPNFPLWKKLCGDDFPKVIAKYYRTCHDAIRRYDRNHLILGDRFKGDVAIPIDGKQVDGMTEEALVAMRDTVDVLSIETMRPRALNMKAKSKEWYNVTGKPILLADFVYFAPTDVLKVPPGSPAYVPDQAARGDAYVRFMRKNYSNPLVVGAHWCSFGRSKYRRSGLLDGNDKPYEDCVSRMRDFNLNEMYKVAAAAGK